ncbi:MAG: SLC13/DASS family transporter, partial [Clostridiales bacterium]|nr:SLC13/DASS family transporter [Clostridiales bacterium]
MSEKKVPMITADSGWKSLDEQNLSPSEFNSEKLKRTIGFIIGPLAFIILLLMPTPAGMTDPAQQVLAITAWTILWWVLEPIPIPASALIPFILIPIMGIMPAADAFAFLGHTNIFLMIG